VPTQYRDTLHAFRSARIFLPGVRYSTDLRDFHEKIGAEELRLSQMVAHILVDIIPVVAEP